MTTTELANARSPEVSRWLWYTSVSGSAATVTYLLVIFLSGPRQLLVFVAFLFAASLSVGSISIWQLLKASGAETPVGMLAAISNVVAGALFVSMVLVQLAIKSVHDPPQEEMKSIYWGLDVAWDLYLAAGTIGFSLAFLRNPWFRTLCIPGVVIASALAVLNLVAFPEPPGSAGLVDVGPLVGLWYTAVTVRAIYLLRSTRQLR